MAWVWVRLLWSEAEGLAIKNRISSSRARLHHLERGFRRFAAAAHLAQTNQTFISFYFYDRTNEAPPTTAVRMTQRRLEGQVTVVALMSVIFIKSAFSAG